MLEIEYKPYVIDVGYLLPPSLADFLGAADEVHIFREVTEQLDVGHLPGMAEEVQELRQELGKAEEETTEMTADRGYFSVDNIKQELLKRKQLIRVEMRARLKKPEKQAIYRKRKWVAEQVIGQIKEGFGFREVTMRGRNLPVPSGSLRMRCTT